MDRKEKTMTKRSAFAGALALVLALGVGAFAISTNLGFDRGSTALAESALKGKKDKPKPIIRRRTIRRDRTVHDKAPAPRTINLGGSGTSGSSGPTTSAPVSSGGFTGDDSGGEDRGDDGGGGEGSDD